VRVDQGGREIATMYPSRRFYKASNQTQSMVADRSTLLSDLYLVYAGDDPETNQPILHAYWNPLIAWIWIGALVIGFGTIIALLPSRTAAARRENPPARVAETAEVAQV
jgi:cytochrome c-type biogenesis protein CcmF